MPSTPINLGSQGQFGVGEVADDQSPAVRRLVSSRSLGVFGMIGAPVGDHLSGLAQLPGQQRQGQSY